MLHSASSVEDMMGIDFWAGILIGFVLSVALALAFWAVTTKILVPKLVISNELAERENTDGTWSYHFTVANGGRRDAVDVIISCTLFSVQWGSDPENHIATIKVPITTGRIGIMPRRKKRSSKRLLDIVGPRVITISPKISDFQAAKLPASMGRRAVAGQVRLSQLMAQGDPSFVSVVVYAYDSFSGSRIVSTDVAFTAVNIVPTARTSN
jgi:hypothetical protein